MSKGHTKDGLTPAQERFCLEVVKPNTTQTAAYRMAFPQAKHWNDQAVWNRASDLARKPVVQVRIKELRETIWRDGIMGVEEAMSRLSTIGRVDMRKCYKPDGSLKLPHEIDDETAIGLTEIEVRERTSTKKGAVRTVGKVRLVKPTEALNMLVKQHTRPIFNRLPPPTGTDTPIDITPEQQNLFEVARRIAFGMALGLKLKKEKDVTP